MVDRREVRATYARIAEHFAATREYPWPEVREFCEGRHAGTALDIGCGNGRHAALLSDHADRVLALDASRELLTIARDRAFDAALLEGDAAAIPLADECVELGVYVATVHHLPTREARIRSLDELGRVLVPGGAALVSAWSTAHGNFDASADDPEGFDTEVDWTLPDGTTVPRFYHVYAPAEFDDDLRASDLTVTESFVSSGNCYAVVTVE